MVSEADDLRGWTIALLVSMSTLAYLALILRLISRYERKQKLWWDDWMIIWSTTWYTVLIGFTAAMLQLGMGLHADVVPPEKIVLVAKLLLIAEILYVFNLVWSKLGVLLMYYRVFRVPFFKKSAIAIGTFIILWVICITFMFIFICVPVQKLWYPQLPGHCINQVGTWIANAVSTIVSDLAILILPIPQVWKLHLRTSEKVALTCVFGLGFFVVCASAYRFRVLFTYSSEDLTYTLARTVGWTVIEITAGIISSCLPILRPSLQFIARNLHLKVPVSGFLGITQSVNFSRRDPSTNNSNGVVKSVSPNEGPLTTGNQFWKENTGTFYRLADDSKSTCPDRMGSAVDANLRPVHGYEYRLESAQEDDRSVTGLEGDDVPLKSISVQKRITQITNH